MKNLEEVHKYLEEKREIYQQIVTSIESALESGSNRILLKKIKMMDTVVDAFAAESEWPTCLQKALRFFEESEDYESCQRCIDTLAKISKK
jgi:hypothetical protein